MVYLIQQIMRNVWIVELEANLIPSRHCPNPDFNSPYILKR